MKKQVKRIALKTDKILSLRKDQAQNVAGGRPSDNATVERDKHTLPTCL